MALNRVHGRRSLPDESPERYGRLGARRSAISGRDQRAPLRQTLGPISRPRCGPFLPGVSGRRRSPRVELVGASIGSKTEMAERSALAAFAGPVAIAAPE